MNAILFSAMTFLTFFAADVGAAPRAELWRRWQQHDAADTRTIDHSEWGAFLQAYVVDKHPSGINRVRYNVVTASDRQRLQEYLEQMRAIPISHFNRQEQLAYWINLYNAVTLNLVLEHFPVESIRDINLSRGFLSGLFAGGPWQAKILTVEAETISLDDIEHRILRPIWRDSRIHYAVNCASLGCPNLQTEAFTAENMERLLNEAARAYVNHPRGASIRNGELVLSKIYDWFEEDFGDGTHGVLAHLRQHTEPALRRQLKDYEGSISYDYDWSLNDAGRL
jgi:hypothetical protein